jgi:hypothetical protein
MNTCRQTLKDKGALPFLEKKNQWYQKDITGMAEATIEGLAFLNRPLREPLGAEAV